MELKTFSPNFATFTHSKKAKIVVSCCLLNGCYCENSRVNERHKSINFPIVPMTHDVWKTREEKKSRTKFKQIFIGKKTRSGETKHRNSQISTTHNIVACRLHKKRTQVVQHNMFTIEELHHSALIVGCERGFLCASHFNPCFYAESLLA